MQYRNISRRFDNTYDSGTTEIHRSVRGKEYTRYSVFGLRYKISSGPSERGVGWRASKVQLVHQPNSTRSLSFFALAKQFLLRVVFMISRLQTYMHSNLYYQKRKSGLKDDVNW